MNERQRIKNSKFLSLVLRHSPDAIGIEPDSQGWVTIEALLAGCRANGRTISFTDLAEITTRCPKQRFAISEDGLRIRANQGHTIDVDLAYPPAVPPDMLYHGTIEAKLGSIRRDGLRPMTRHHVHLSIDRATARSVGARRGRPVILIIQSGRMSNDGHVFYRTHNGVWLTDSVPQEYIVFPDA